MKGLLVQIKITGREFELGELYQKINQRLKIRFIWALKTVL